jgi:L-fuconolactonase
LICIDAHQHFWSLERGDYGWLTPAAGALYRDFSPGDLLPELASCGIHATVLVQAAPTEGETRHLLALARQHSYIAGVVGWIDFEAPDAPKRIRALLEESGGLLKGLRPMVQGIADPHWLARPSLDAAFETMIECDLAFDALVKPHHLRVLMDRLCRHPRLRAVLDHAGKPDVANAGAGRWRQDIEALARTTSASCKLSGLLSEAPPNAAVDELEFVGATLFEHFGPARLLWGSDWPVLTLRASYRRWLEIALELVRRQAPESVGEIFGGNAVRFYRLNVET